MNNKISIINLSLVGCLVLIFLTVLALAAPNDRQSETTTGEIQRTNSRNYNSLKQTRECGETKKLAGPERIFVDFCRKARDYVLDHMRETAMTHASIALKNILYGANRLATEVVSVETDFIKEVMKQITNPKEDGDDSEGSSNSRGRKKQNGLFPNLAAGFIDMMFKASSNILQKLLQIHGNMNPKAFGDGINNACNVISQYEDKLEGDFMNEKLELSSMPELKDDEKEFLQTVTMASLRCFTVENVVRFSSFCEIFKKANEPFLKMMTVGRPQKGSPNSSRNGAGSFTYDDKLQFA